MESSSRNPFQRRHTFTSENGPIARSMMRLEKDDGGSRAPQFVGRMATWPLSTRRSGRGLIKRRASGSRMGEAAGWTWDLSDESLKPVPLDQTLDRSSMELSLPIETILTKVANFMRVTSVACFFHTESGKIDCQTPTLLRFAVFFWRGPKDTVIVELQRRRGSAIEMHRLRKTLFDAIQMEQEPTRDSLERCTTPSPRSICPLVRKMYNEEKETKTETESERQTQCCKDGMTKCNDLLDSHFEDQNRLGMESLVFLTDATTATTKTVQYISGALLFGEGPCAESLRDELLYYFRLTDHAEDGEDASWLNEDNETFEYGEGHNFLVMHFLALRVLSNSLQAMEELEDNSKTIDSSCDFWQTVCRALEYNLKEAARRPQEAALSAKCLNFIEQMGCDEVCHWVEDRLLAVLIEANRFGKVHDFQLEQETARLLSGMTDTSR